MSDPLLPSGMTDARAPQRSAVRAQLPHLTTLRFFAAFWVLGFHTIPRAADDGAWNAFWGRGWMGVTFFFVLSGFILAYTYGATATTVDRRQFWVARVARVYPLYLFALLFSIPQLWHTVGEFGTQGEVVSGARLAGIVVSSLAMLQAWVDSWVCVWNCPSWSLSVEAFFYALFPFLLPLIATRMGRRFLLIGTIAGLGISLSASSGAAVGALAQEASMSSLNPLARLPEFLLGLWLGGVYLARRPSWTLAMPLALAAGCATVALAVWSGMHPAFHAPHLVAAPLFALIVWAVAASPNPSRGLLAFAPLVLLGESSYALYLLHGPLHGYALAIFRRVAPGVGSWGVFVLYALMTIVVSIASYRWLEVPSRGWIRGRFAAVRRSTTTG